MREILFRGKRVDNGEWVYGFLFQYKAGQVGIGQTKMTTEVAYSEPEYNDFEHINIRDLYCPKVIPETVGQYTGLTDKNGTKIFEGDIVRLVNEEYTVRFGIAGFELLRKVVSVPIGTWYGTDAIGDDGTLFEVIGNIHDNKELLGVE